MRTGGEDPLVAIQIQDRNGMTETISSSDRLDAYLDVDFLHSQPYKKVLRVYKNQGRNHTKITTYHPNGNVWQYLEAEEQRAHGAYREWYQNGQMRIEAYVIGGTADVTAGSQHDWLFDGTSRVWDEQGKLQAEIPYKEGSLHGMSVYYYPNGQIERELPYEGGELQGNVVEYHKNGKIRSKTHYTHDKKQGESSGFFEGGQVAWAEEFAGGLLLKGAYFDEQGKMISSVEDGMGYRALYEGSFPTHLVQIFQGAVEGIVKQFTPQGELKLTYSLKNGKKQGEEIAYYLAKERVDRGGDPIPKLSIQWDRDAIHGVVKTWYNNGQIQSQKEFSRNKKSGTALSWYRDGSLMLIEEYEEDKLTKGQYYKRNGRDPVSSILNGNGVATLYDEEGVFLKKVIYAKGEPLDPES